MVGLTSSNCLFIKKVKLLLSVININFTPRIQQSNFFNAKHTPVNSRSVDPIFFYVPLKCVEPYNIGLSTNLPGLTSDVVREHNQFLLLSTVIIKGSLLSIFGKARIGAVINFFFNVSKASFASSVHTNSF